MQQRFGEFQCPDSGNESGLDPANIGENSRAETAKTTVTNDVAVLDDESGQFVEDYYVDENPPEDYGDLCEDCQASSMKLVIGLPVIR